MVKLSDFDEEVLTFIHRYLGIRNTIKVCCVSKDWAQSLKRMFVCHAHIQDARMPMTDGMDFHSTLDIARFCLIYQNLHNPSIPIDGPSALNRLRMMGKNSELSLITGKMYSHFDQSPCKGRKSISKMMIEMVRDRWYELTDDLQRSVLQEAHRWKTQRYSGTWYVFLDRPDGVVLISSDFKQVFLVVSLVDKLFDIVSNASRNLYRTQRPPFLISTVLLPFRDYITYDGLLGAASDPYLASQIDDKLRRKLLNVYLDAIDKGTLISKPVPTDLNSKEVEEEDYLNRDGSTYQPSSSEQAMLRRIRSRVAQRNPSIDMTDVRMWWTFRRSGYSAQENPMKQCIVFSGSGEVVTFDVKCSGAAIGRTGPSVTVMDILGGIDRATSQGHPVPTMIMVDQIEIITILAKLFENDGIRVEFYPPPDETETNAAMSLDGPGMGSNPRQAALSKKISISYYVEVMITGLVNAAQYNGMKGKVKNFNTSTGRYTVMLDASPFAPSTNSGASDTSKKSNTNSVKVKAVNLVQLITVRKGQQYAKVLDRVTRPLPPPPGHEADDTKEADTTETLYLVELLNLEMVGGLLVEKGKKSGGMSKSGKQEEKEKKTEYWKIDDFQCLEDTCVVLQGLKKAQHLNGKNGLVIGYDEESTRYQVMLDDMEENSNSEVVEPFKKNVVVKVLRSNVLI